MLFSTPLGHRIRLLCCLIAMVGMLTAGGLAWLFAGVPVSPYGLLSAWDEPLGSQPPPDPSLAIWSVYGHGTSWQRAPDALGELGFLYGRYDPELGPPSYSSPLDRTPESEP